MLDWIATDIPGRDAEQSGETGSGGDGAPETLNPSNPME